MPFGGRAPIFSTNPYAFAMPGGCFGPIVADFATSTVADGKVAVYRAEGKTLPEGWILDKEGKPSTDPEAFFDGGMHLPDIFIFQPLYHEGERIAIAATIMPIRPPMDVPTQSTEVTPSRAISALASAIYWG